MVSHREKTLNDAVSSTAKLYEILKNMGVDDSTGEWLQFLHWNRAIKKEQKQARSLMDKIVQILVQENNQISSKLIYDRVLYGLIQKAIWFEEEYPDFPASVREELNLLLEYKEQWVIGFPLKYLDVESKLLKFGLITISNLSENEWEQELRKKIKGAGGSKNDVSSYASVIC